MQAVILARGLGARLSEETTFLPGPLVEDITASLAFRRVYGRLAAIADGCRPGRVDVFATPDRHDREQVWATSAALRKCW